MKKILLGSVALIALGTSAFAADLPARTYTKAPAYVPAPIYNWTGFYIGGHLGGAFGGNSAFGSNDGRFLGGLQVGADYQFAPNWVVGIEGQYSWTARDTQSVAFVPAGFTISDRNSNLGSVTGRLGYTWGPALLYAKGGVAFREKNNVFVTNSATGAALPFTSSSDDVGYTVGAGLEYLFAQNWSAKVEYQYYNFGKTNVNLVAPGTGLATAVSYDRDVHTVKAGINYRFNWGGPVVAKY
ncbi:MAG: outer membrane protein [Pseudomonadota bacterium]